MRTYVEGRRVIVLGSAPCVVSAKDKLDDYDIIVRLNNYKHFSDCKRTDIYYSFFGSSIKKTEDELIDDGCKYIIHKYPDLDFTLHYKQSDGLAVDCTDDKYKRFWSIPIYRPEKSDLVLNYMMADRMLTTGLSAILQMIRLGGNVTIAGFDFFESGVHNLDEAWKPNDGNHNMKREKEIVDMLELYKIIKVIR